MPETISSGGLEFEAAWVRCRASRSFKPDEALVRIVVPEMAERAAYYVDSDLVEPPELPANGEIEGHVKVLLLDRQNGTAVIEVPGEPISHGPKLFVESNQLR